MISTLVLFRACAAEKNVAQSYISSLRSLLCMLDKARVSRKFRFKIDFLIGFTNNKNSRK